MSESVLDGIVHPQLEAGCRARPRAGRAAYRDDMSCGTTASATVRHYGLDVAVCRIHEAVYGRWASHAEGNATARWAWPDEVTLLPGFADVSPPRVA